MTASQVCEDTGPQSTCTGSSGSVVQPEGSSRTGFGSQVTSSPYKATGSQISPIVGSPAPGTKVSRPSTSVNSSDDDRPIWEQPLGKKKPKWLWETLKEAKDFGMPKEPLVRAIVMPDRLGMALVASLRDSEPSTFEEASQHHVWRDAMMDEYHSIMKNDVWEIVSKIQSTDNFCNDLWCYWLLIKAHKGQKLSKYSKKASERHQKRF